MAPRTRTTESPAPAKPRLRGVLHQYGAMVSAVAGLILVALAPEGRATIATAIFSGSLVVLFTVSAIYHRVNWTPGPRAWMRRADHACIFLLIAGSYTPPALLGLPEDIGESVMYLVWGGAALGIAKSLFWVHGPKVVTAALAAGVGWTIAPYIGDLHAAYGNTIFGLLLAGGILYSIGAVVYATKRPALWPKTFGYHELFHALTLAAAGLHFIAVIAIVRSFGGA